MVFNDRKINDVKLLWNDRADGMGQNYMWPTYVDRNRSKSVQICWNLSIWTAFRLMYLFSLGLPRPGSIALAERWLKIWFVLSTNKQYNIYTVLVECRASMTDAGSTFTQYLVKLLYCTFYGCCGYITCNMRR